VGFPDFARRLQEVTSKGKRYTNEFKTETVKHVKRGYSVAEVTERLGICTKTLYQWRTDQSNSPKDVKVPDAQAEIARLKAELDRVPEERDIFKKAARHFANNPE
jgi:transposase